MSLHDYCRTKNHEMVESLISSGTDLNTCNREGFTPLHIASSRDLVIAQMLVSSGANVNIKDKDGFCRELI
jgi:ankyrin repeat protein